MIPFLQRGKLLVNSEDNLAAYTYRTAFHWANSFSRIDENAEIVF